MTTSENTPKGKRTIRQNIYGNLNGYVSGKFWCTFGDAYFAPNQRDAEAWLNEQN